MNCPKCEKEHYPDPTRCYTCGDALVPEPARPLGFVDVQRVARLLARWREREREYEAEWKEAAARGKEGDRLAAADIAMEVRVCCRELEDLIRAGEEPNVPDETTPDMTTKDHE